MDARSFGDDWGGWRAITRSRRRKVAHATRPELSEHHPVLIRMHCRFDVLRAESVFDAVWRALARRRVAGCSKIPLDEHRVAHFSVQDDHVHLIVEARDKRSLSRGMQGLAIRLAKQINRVLGRRGKVWVERYESYQLKTPKAVRNALVYVLQNRKKHGPLHDAVDPCSTAHYLPWKDADPHWSLFVDLFIFAELRSRVDPICKPRTWLLRFGWERCGSIAVTEAPAKAA